MQAPRCILVVEDDAAVREAITTALGQRYAVEAVSTGSEAIAAICATYFDLVLLDHRLPDARGTDLLKLIKRFFPSTTVVLITGHGSEDVATAALQGGARDYLRKPIALGELRARIDTLFTIRQRGFERRRAESVQASDERASEPEEAGRARSLLRAVQHLRANLGTPLSLADVARVRIAAAKKLLQVPERTIGEVARAVGIRDPTHFARLFRTLEHLVPSEYRRRVATPATTREPEHRAAPGERG